MKKTNKAKSLLKKVHLKLTSLNLEEYVIATNAKSDGLKTVNFKVMEKELTQINFLKSVTFQKEFLKKKLNLLTQRQVSVDKYWTGMSSSIKEIISKWY